MRIACPPILYPDYYGIDTPDRDKLLAATRDLGIDLSRSWLVGDAGRDIDAGRAAGCRTILLGAAGDANPHHAVRTLPDAADTILLSGAQPRDSGVDSA